MIIALSGKIGSGKDLSAKIIQYHFAKNRVTSCSSISLDFWLERYDDLSSLSGFEIRSLAGKIKDAACILLGCSRSDLENRAYKEAPLGHLWSLPTDVASGYSWSGEMTPRLLLQLLGTECGRNTIHPNIWINALLADYVAVDNREPDWIVTDMRFPNDLAALKSIGAVTVRINRQSSGIFSTYSEHESETALDDTVGFDMVISNDGSVLDLSRSLFEMLEHRGLL